MTLVDAIKIILADAPARLMARVFDPEVGMNYPVWELAPFGGGMLIALVAVLHVFISHFAVGGGLFLALWERKARRDGDQSKLAYLKTHSRFFLLVSLVLGALTGVGIWFTIQLIQPTGTSALIHNLFWGWAIEWIFFFVEITAAILYYYTWDRLDGRRHQMLAWIYFIAAYMSLVIINGIITFMLTPGAWLQTQAFWTGFFNPTYWPSLIFRTGIALGLAGIYALLTLSLNKDEGFRLRAVRSAGWWVLIGFVMMALTVPWYVRQLPAETQALMRGHWPEVELWLLRGQVFAGVALLVTLTAALIRPRWMRFGVAVVLMLLGLGNFGAFETIREMIRKPYVVSGLIYSNSLYVDEVDAVRSAGILEQARWIDAESLGRAEERGRQIAHLACSGCHASRGYRDFEGLLAGYDETRLRSFLRGLEDTRWQMPPFPGNDRDAEDLVSHLASQMTPAPPASSGEEVYARRCFACHDLRGEFRPLADYFEDTSAADIDEFVAELGGDDSVSMPPFGGTDAERGLLAEWLEKQLSTAGGDS